MLQTVLQKSTMMIKMLPSWENTVENLKINGKSITDNIKNLLEDLQDDKERELKHFAMHIPESLQMTLNLTQAEIQGDDPVDTRFW